jgi:hypothetical protein
MSKHKDVEYHVESGGETRVFSEPKAALEETASMAMSRGKAILDVVIWSRAGAKAYGGDDATERYDEDPEASVFERYEFRCNFVGRVP